MTPLDQLQAIEDALAAARAELEQCMHDIAVGCDPAPARATAFALSGDIARLEARERAWHDKQRAESELDVPEVWR